MSRIGKIARLPQNIRDQINEKLPNGIHGVEILYWLNELPVVTVNPSPANPPEINPKPRTRKKMTNSSPKNSTPKPSRLLPPRKRSVRKKV